MRFDMIQTLALAAVVLFIGYGIRRRVAVLDRYNIPAPVVGGFLFAAISLTLRLTGAMAFEFDTTLQTPLMIAFFTTIGLGASLALLKVGGPQVLMFFLLASTLAVIPFPATIALAWAMAFLVAGVAMATGKRGHHAGEHCNANAGAGGCDMVHRCKLISWSG